MKDVVVVDSKVNLAMNPTKMLTRKYSSASNVAAKIRIHNEVKNSSAHLPSDAASYAQTNLKSKVGSHTPHSPLLNAIKATLLLRLHAQGVEKSEMELGTV